LGAEVALAFVAGLASFSVVSLAVIAGNSAGLVILILALCIAAVGGMFRFWGVEYAVPAALAAVLAFDWFYIPPTHSHAFPDAENLANLVAAIAVGVLVGALAARAGRRADASELARGELAEEQAALRRVATLVAQGVTAPQLLAAVAKEAGTLLDVDGAWIECYEGEEVLTAAQWSKPGKDPPTFDRARLEEAPVAAAVRRTGRVVRIDDSEDVQPRPIPARGAGEVSLVGAPISVEGAQWGVLLAWSQDSPLPDDADQQLTHFTELVATAIANSDARTEVSRLADQQAALRRVATLVAREVSPEELFKTVCDELERLLGIEEVDLVRVEGDRTCTVLSFGGRNVGDFPVGSRLPVEGTNAVSLVAESGRPARIDDYSTATGPMGEIARSAGIRGVVGCPIVVQGRLWGVVVAATRREDPLPADSESRIGEFTELVATAIANAEARREVATLANEQAALRRVATLVAEGVPPSEMFAAVARELGQLLGVDSTHLARYEPDDTAIGVGSWSAHGADAPIGLHVPLDGTTVTSLVHESGRPARLDGYEHVSGPASELIEGLGIRSSVGAPITVDGQPWGVMIAASNRPEPLAPGTEARIAAFTDLIATAISNTEARSETRRLADEQAALSRVATLVAEDVPSEELFAAVVDEVGTLFGADLATLLRYEDENTATLVSTWTADGVPLEGPRTWSMTEMGLTRTLAQGNWPTRVDDWNEFSGPLAEYVREVAGVTSSVGSSIIVEGRLWGALTVHSTQEEPIPVGAELRLRQFTELVATAISNTEARSETRRLADEQAALRRVATAVAEAAPPGELFDAVVAEVGVLLGADLATMIRFEGEGKARSTAMWAAVGEVPALDGIWPLEQTGLTGTIARTGRPARLDDWDRVPGISAAFVREKLGLVSSVGCPIHVEGRLWGVLLVHSTHEEPLPPDTEAHLEEFTELVATAIANTQARSELSASRARIVAATDNERRRVVRDLHDGAQQRLVHTVVTLKLASQALEDESGKEVPPLVTEALDHAQEATDELRELAHGILPSVLTQGGLRAGVGALASRMPVPVENGVSVDRLPSPVEATAYFIVAEALTNVAKHSHASHAAVTAQIGNGTLHLQVRDDGVGGAKADGTGLIGLADRVSAVDGTLRLESPSDGGTLLAADIPVPPRD
jgi:GAF domain-containing protein